MSIQLSGVDLIDLAVETERRGEEFYRSAATNAGSPEALDLFRYLADEEVKHRRTFEELSGQVKMTEVDPTAREEVLGYIQTTIDREFFSGEAQPIREVLAGASLEEMILQAISFEQQTLLFFHALRDLAHPANRQIIDEIVREERRHVLRLSEMLE